MTGAPRSLASFRQSKDALADYVVLNLVGAGRDRSAAGRQHPMRPLASVDCAGGLVLELAVRAEQLHRERLDAQIEVRRPELQDRSFRPGRHTSELSRELPHAGVLERLGLASEGCDFL